MKRVAPREAIPRIDAVPVTRRSRLFANKLALAGNPLMRFGGGLDAILKLAVAFRQLLGYHVAATGSIPVDGVRRECASLVHSKFMFCH